MRGLEYYTGPVFEVELTFEIEDEKGRPIRFGSVGGGGRYDGLVSRFSGQPTPATGFSIGVSRLQAALTALGKISSEPEPGPVVVTVFDRDRVADYQRMVSALRAADIRAELYLGNPKNIGNQLKYADKRNAPCVVIQGGDEKAKGEVLIKDLVVGAEIADDVEGTRRVSEEAGRGAVLGAGGAARRRGAGNSGEARTLSVRVPGAARHGSARCRPGTAQTYELSTAPEAAAFRFAHAASHPGQVATASAPVPSPSATRSRSSSCRST